MKDKISIVTICYNLKNEIERTLRSALSQTYPNLEFVIVDGGSTDGTIDVIRKVISKYPQAKINFKSEKDCGIYDAMNKGIERATGDWVIFMNGGDWFHSDTCIEKFFTRVEDDTIIAHGDIIHEDPGYRFRMGAQPLEQMSKMMVVRHQSTFTRLSYHKNHLFDTSYRSAGDYDFFYKAHFIDKVKFQYIPLVIGHFNGTGGESTSNKWRSQLEYLKVRGVDTSTIDMIRMRFIHAEIALKIWIKKHLMSRKRAIALEVARARRIGGTEIEID